MSSLIQWICMRNKQIGVRGHTTSFQDFKEKIIFVDK